MEEQPSEKQQLTKSQRKNRKRQQKKKATAEPPSPTTPLVTAASMTSSSDVHSLSESLAPNMTLVAQPQRNRVCDMVARPGYGTIGKAVQVYANMFPVKFKAIDVHQYDVTIQFSARPAGGGRGRGGRRGRGRGGGRAGVSRPQEAKEPQAELIDLVYKELDKGGRTFPPGTSFDGQKFLYVPQTYMQPINNREVSIMVDDKQKTFTVSVKHIGTMNLSALASYMAGDVLEYPAIAVHAMDVAIRHIAALQRNTVRQETGIFKCDDLAQMISPGVHAWAGYVQSVRPCQLGLCLNMNSCFAPMIKQETVAEFMAAFVSRRVGRQVPLNQIHQHLTDKMYQEMDSKINKLKAKTIHNPRKEVHPKLAGFTNRTSIETTFDVPHKGKMNVAQYMRTTNNYEVRYPNLRLVSTYKGDKISRVAFPPECVQIKGVSYRRKLSENQKDRLIQIATQKPAEKKRYIEMRLKNQIDEGANKKHMQQWGMTVDTEMQVIPGRVLPTPAMEGGDEEFIDVKGRGEWDVKDHKFKQPMAVRSWAFVNFCAPDNLNPVLGPFFNQLMEMMRKKGMEVVGRPHKTDVSKREMRDSRRILQQAARDAEAKFGAKCQILLVLMPDFKEGSGQNEVSTDDLYTHIKVASDQCVGIPSQCMLTTNAGLVERTADHNRQAYLAHLTLKINAKLGGINYNLYTIEGDHPAFLYPKLGNKPFMVMGADLTHPPPKSEDQRSVVGIVGSMNDTLTKYACRTQFQQPGLDTGREVIHDLKNAVKDLLKTFAARNNGLKPEAILFYRDGVSQGEYPKVVQHEYQAIRNACAEMGDPSAEYCPPISFIVVQKRHAMRFMPTDNNKDASGNVLPGTCVDTHVCHPHGFDFYLNSHAGILGTSRPTLYSVLVDEVRFTPDELQVLTYWMCHLFCRCTKSVSYCPPAYYAHHAAARGKTLLLHGSDNAASPVHPQLQDSLFFI